MAVIDVEWPYWYDAFFAQALSPISADILFTVALLVISDVFPQRTQALAGAVFNTVSQFGNSLGLTVTAVISSLATKRAAASPADDQSPGPLLVGYKAGFWAAFAWMMCAFSIGGVWITEDWQGWDEEGLSVLHIWYSSYMGVYRLRHLVSQKFIDIYYIEIYRGYTECRLVNDRPLFEHTQKLSSGLGTYSPLQSLKQTARIESQVCKSGHQVLDFTQFLFIPEYNLSTDAMIMTR